MSKPLVYTITFVVCILFQAGISPAISVAGCAPDFLLIPVMLVAMRSGAGAGGTAGFFCGLLYDLMGANVIGGMALSMTIMAMVVGLLASNLNSTSVATVVVFAVVASLFVELVYGIIVMLTAIDAGGAAAVLVFHSIPTALYSAVFAIIGLLTIGLVLADDAPSMPAQLGGGMNRNKMPRMKSRLK